MYTPKLYREEDRSKILESMRQNEFATLVCYSGQRPAASHLLVEAMKQTRFPLSVRDTSVVKYPPL